MKRLIHQLCVLLVLPALVGCYQDFYDETVEAGYLVIEGDTTNNPVTLEQGIQLIDSLIATEPWPHPFNDSLARRDSSAIGYLYLTKVSHEYYHKKDTVAAALAYFDALPWLPASRPRPKADVTRRFAETLADAMFHTHSTNSATMVYQAFERAKQLALAYGDPYYVNLADSSYKAVARQVLTMPDSVRIAFGPAPDRPTHMPWVLATLAAAFIASVAGCWKEEGTTNTS